MQRTVLLLLTKLLGATGQKARTVQTVHFIWQSNTTVKTMILQCHQKWYKRQPLGENTLRAIMKNMAKRADLPGRKTNHSARKSTCTK